MIVLIIVGVYVVMLWVIVEWECLYWSLVEIGWVDGIEILYWDGFDVDF